MQPDYIFAFGRVFVGRLLFPHCLVVTRSPPEVITPYMRGFARIDPIA